MRGINVNNLVIGLLLFVTVFLPKGTLTSLLSIALIIIFGFHLLNNNIGIIFRYLHYFFGAISAILGCIVIEFSNINLYEIGEQSFFVGAIPTQCFIYWIFISIIKTHDSRVSTKLHLKEEKMSVLAIDYLGDDGKGNKLVELMVVASFLVSMYLFLNVCRTPSFLLGMDRFQYQRAFNYGNIYTYFTKLIKYLVVPCIVSIVVRKRMIAIIALIPYVLFSFWTGNKFGPFFSILCYLTMIYSEAAIKLYEERKGVILKLILALLLLVLIAVIALSFTNNMQLSDYLFSRIAQQGQMWWKTFHMSNEWHIEKFQNEIEAIYNQSSNPIDNINANHGIYNIMYFVAPKSIVDAKILSGSWYTEAGFAAAYYYCGTFGCVILAITGGLIVSTVVNWFIYFLKYNQYLRAFLCLRIYSITTNFMSGFDFTAYFGIASILSYIVLMTTTRKIFTYKELQV